MSGATKRARWPRGASAQFPQSGGRGAQAFVSHLCELPRPGKMLFTQVLERHLDALIIEFLIVGTKLIAATGGAVEELGYLADRSMWLSFELGRAANVDGAIEINVVDVVIELTHQQARHRLVA